jgi:hypothetical protein
VDYREITDKGLEIQQQRDKQVYLIGGKHIIPTQDWGPNSAVIDRFKGLVPEIHVIGSCREPGLIVDAMKEGALVGYAI